MKAKIQVVVPCFLDPLLCQLYFRNYANHKNKHIDRLIILVSPYEWTNFMVCVRTDGRQGVEQGPIQEADVSGDEEVITQINQKAPL
tara:strand:- start:10 stop:270 length:261 start_codon:yes stop_codon:yes gene_type:complete